jgi:Ca-activated chloride channel family protein
MPETLFGLQLMRPLWLLCALPALLLTMLLWQQRGRSAGWSRVIAPELLRYLVPEQQQRRRSNLLLLVCAAWLLACLAAAGPSWKKIPQPVEQVEDALVLVLDLSYSMKSTDQAPSRLDRARQKLLDLLATRREGQTGLVAYAGDAHVVTPLTDDTGTIANLLPALNPDMMPLPGSDTPGALRLAVELLQSAGVNGGRILLLSDGVNADEVPRMARQLRGANVTLSVLGLGTANGAPIPLPRGGFLRDDAGAIVIPRLDEGPLRALAEAAGGRYQRLQVDDSDLEMLLAQAATATETRLAEGLTADAWEDQGYWLIMLLLPLALALFRRGWLLGLLPLLLLLEAETAQAQALQNLWLTPDQQARRALDAGDAERAAALFEDPAWAGTAAYRAGDYAAAADHFQGADSADSWYNRGNALARAGDLEGAIEAYRRSLELAPGREDAADNLALVEDLQQQQEQQEQQSGEDGEPPPDSGEDGQGQEQEQAETAEQEGEQPPQESEPDQGSPQDASSGTQDEGSTEDDSATPEPESGPAPEPEAPEPLSNIEVPELSLEEAERNQAMEQWLRRVPDDPSGLLREKFRYESRKRQQQPGSDNERDW